MHIFICIKMCCYLNNSKGFTLAELITSIAIIGILAAVGIQQYSQYKVRGYDAHSKQALHDMNLTCKAYWTENGTSDECDLGKSKEYGFVQHPNVVANLPSSMLDTFCASAKHNSSPNTYSMDSAALISEGKGCGAGGASDPGHTFESYKPPENACGADGWAKGAWVAVGVDGKQSKDYGTFFRDYEHGRWFVCACAACADTDNYPNIRVRKDQKELNIKYVFGGLLNEEQEKEWRAYGQYDPGSALGLATSGRYNFATGIWDQ